MTKYRVTIMNARCNIVKQKEIESIKEARAYCVRVLKSDAKNGTAFIDVAGRGYSVKDSFMDAPGGRIECGRRGKYYFCQDGVCWTVYKDGSIGNKEVN